MDFVREGHERLVLKPNRSFGGEGVVIGHLLSRDDWLKAVDQALADPERWVVQELANIPVSAFPVIGPGGRINFEPFYTVMGFAATKYGLAILGRASQKQVVNVGRRPAGNHLVQCLSTVSRRPLGNAVNRLIVRSTF